MSRTRLLLAALAAVLAAGAVAVQASAVSRPRAHAASGLQIGISDNHPTTFSDPRFRWLGMGIARLVVPWDIVKPRTELGGQNAWVQAGPAARGTPLVG